MTGRFFAWGGMHPSEAEPPLKTTDETRCGPVWRAARLCVEAKMKKQLTIGLLAALTLTSPVWAEEVDEIVVSATGIPTPISQIGSSVDIITAEDLEQQQITYLQDALKLKGVNVGQNGGPGTLSNVFLRGLPSKHLTLIIDGVAVTDPQLDYPIWGDVVSDGVGQIEVLRGPQGVLYGSNTIAGVISQFTAIGGDVLNQLRLEAGEFGTTKFVLSGQGESSNIEYGYSISQYDTDGFSARTTPQAGATSLEDDPYENRTFNVKLRSYLNSVTSLEFVVRASEGDLATDGFSTDDPNEKESFERNTARIAFTIDHNGWSHRIGMNMYDNDIQRFGAFSSAADTERSVADYQGIYDLDNGAQFLVGATSVESDDGSNEVDTNSFYSLLQYPLSDFLTATVATRRDDHDLFGSHDTFRTTLAYSISDEVLMRFSHGTGFRAPSLDELYSTYSGGNPNFKPADSVSTEFGAEILLTDALQASATVFVAEIEDAIEYSFSTSSYQQYQGTSEVSGLEADLSYAASDRLSIELNAVYTDSKRPKNDGSQGLERQGRVPRVQAGLSADYAMNDALSFSLAARHVKGAVENVGLNLTEFDDYTLLDLRAAYQINDRVKAYGRIENATDEDYETARDYATAGQALYIGLTKRF